MNSLSMAGRGLGSGCMLGTNHLFGEQSGSSAVCLRQLFPHCPIFSQPWTSCSDWLKGLHFLHPRERRQWWRQLEQDGVWKGGADMRRRKSAFFYLPRPLPSSCKWTSKPSVAGEPSTGRDGKSIRNNLRNGALRSNFLAHVPKILRTQLLQG